MVKTNQPEDLLRIVLSVLCMSVMIVACIWIIRPFLLGLAWAGTIVITSWPLLIKLERLLWGKRILAVIAMMLLLIMIFVIPISLLASSLVQNSAPLIEWAKEGHFVLPTLDWLHDIPVVGNSLHNLWNSLLNSGGNALFDRVKPYIGMTTSWFLNQAIQIGSLFIHLGLMLLFSIVLFAKGESIGFSLRHFAARLAPRRGDAAVILASQAIRAVALGVVVTALAQGILGGIGLAISGIPFASLLTVVMILCCLVQVGPLLVLVPAIIWLYWSGDATWGTLLLIWSCVVGTMDSVIRPVLIRMGADLPMVLILCGVIGGLIAFGLIGLFIGPMLLAVSYRLVLVWMDEVPEPHDAPHKVIEQIEENMHQEASDK
ncbi:AI-2E family transporter YdiK [Citrobacter sp. JGM124]|uniref:AI-2E family transporter YdiK n=1 Tax=Citrobacter sp. JGM124 TaxID=2799789 RepID=UPI001BA752A6|nr:AI-2E family transporter YdiK [Citrobacter sp. JGM124]MBS0847492.1 AI-2E family transporter YdiK [Citrobacter sp. JGM124]